MKNKNNPTKKTSSNLLIYLLGNIERYEKILVKETKKLKKKYSNKNLASVFSIIPKKLITIGPMALCDDLTQDLGKSCNDNILAAIGLSCFPITTHDDVVDETPEERAKLAALIYAGNIAGLEGTNLLFKENYGELAEILFKTIIKNHYQQQFRVELLWDKKPKNFKDYKEGIKDVCSLTSIGPLCALAITKRYDLTKKINNFAANYSIVLQLIDDIREIEEDKLTSYTSFPLLENKPFKKSFKAINIYLKKN